MLKIKHILLSLILLNSCIVYAQNVGEEFFYDNDTALNKIFYFHSAKDKYLIDSIKKVLYDWNDVHYCDEMFLPNSPLYQYLSTEGSASQSLMFQTMDLLDIQRQNNSYSPYIFTKKNIKYFQNKDAYTSFSYSNGINSGQYLDVNFAKNLYKGLNLQTEYKVNYADGEFENSQVMNQFFNVTLNYISKNGIYKTNGAFVHNRAYILENGGLTSDTAFLNQDYSSPNTYPTNLSEGWSKWKTNEFYFNQSLRLSKDTTHQNILNSGALIHSMSFEKYARLYSDENKSFTDSLASRFFKNSIFWTNDIYSNIHSSFFLPIIIGLNYDIIKFSDSLSEDKSIMFTPEIKVALRRNSTSNYPIEIDFKRCFSSSKYDNDYQLGLNINSLVSKTIEGKLLFNSYLKFNIQKKQADYVFEHYNTENILWENNVGKTSTKSATLGLNWKQKLNLEISYFNLKNMYWFDEELNLNSGNTSLYQVILKNNFKTKNREEKSNFLGFKGIYMLQYSTNDEVVRLPLLAFKQGLYYDFTMINKKLNSQIGLDLNYFTSYYADSYNTQTGLFTRQNQRKIGNYLYANVYFNIKIQRFTLYLEVSHPYASMFSRNYFNTPLYPHHAFMFRYGINWKFLD